VFEGLPGWLVPADRLVHGAPSTALIASREARVAGLRLMPGRETGRTLVLMVVGMLALGQVLDSLTMLAGLGQQAAW